MAVNPTGPTNPSAQFGQAAEALLQLAARLDSLAQKQLSGTPPAAQLPPSMGGAPGGLPGGGPGGGGFGGGVPAAGQMLAAVAAVGALAGQVDRAVGTFQKINSTLNTADSRFQSLAETIPVLGGAIKNVYNAANTLDHALSDRGARERTTEYQMAKYYDRPREVQIAGAAESNAAEREARDLNLRDRSGGSANYQKAVAGTPYSSAAARLGRSDTADEYQEREESARRAAAVARGELTTARDVEAKSREYSGESERKLRSLAVNEATGIDADTTTEARRDALRKLSVASKEGKLYSDDGQTKLSSGSGLRRDLAERSSKLQGDAQIQLAQASRAEKEIADTKERALSTAEKALAVGKADQEMLRSKADTLKRQEQESKSAAVSYGSQDPASRATLINAARQYKKVGFEALTPDMKNLLLGNPITGETVRADAEKFANKDPAFQQLLGEYGRQNSDATKAGRVKVEQDIKVKVEIDEGAYRKTLEKVVAEFNKKQNDLKFQIENLMRLKIDSESGQRQAAS